MSLENITIIIFCGKHRINKLSLPSITEVSAREVSGNSSFSLLYFWGKCSFFNSLCPKWQGTYLPTFPGGAFVNLKRVEGNLTRDEFLWKVLKQPTSKDIDSYYLSRGTLGILCDDKPQDFFYFPIYSF